MRLVHQQNKVVELREVLVVALADRLLQPLHTRLPARALFLVNLVNVEDVDVHVGTEQIRCAPGFEPHAAARLVILPRDDVRRVGREFRNPAKDVFRALRREIGDELVVNGRVRCQHEEVAAALREIKIRYEGAHQSCLADAGRQREAQRRKLPLEIFDLRIDCLDRGKRRRAIGVLAERYAAQHIGEHFERGDLRRTQR